MAAQHCSHITLLGQALQHQNHFPTAPHVTMLLNLKRKLPGIQNAINQIANGFYDRSIKVCGG